MADIIVRDWDGTTTEAEMGTDPNAKLDLIITMLRGQGATQADLVKLIGGVAVPVESSASGYHFKVAPELLWAVGTAAGTVLLQSLTDVDKISDYRTWAVGVGAALIRAVIGAALSQSKPKPEAQA